MLRIHRWDVKSGLGGQGNAPVVYFLIVVGQRLVRWSSCLLSWLSSLRLTVWVLTLLSIASGIGAIIPQIPTTPNADVIYRQYGTIPYLIIKLFGLGDVFHSWWFITLLALFAVNLVSCTARRLTRTIRIIKSSPEAWGEPNLDRAIVVNLEEPLLMLAEIRRAVVKALSQKKLRIQVVGNHVTGTRWPYGQLGPDIVHVGVAIILVGALLGAFRFQGKLYVSELQVGEVFKTCGASDEGNCLKGVPFNVRIDDFGVDLYPGTILPKQYWAIVTVLENGMEVRTQRIEVNRPLTYRGINFYQTFYGYDLNAAQIALLVVDWEKRINLGVFKVRLGEAIRLPNSEDVVVFARFFTNYTLKPDGTPVNADLPTPQNPAAILVVHQRSSVYSATLLANSPYPYSHPGSAYTFYLQSYYVPRYLGLTYSWDPGYSIVFGGFVVVMVGLAWSFYFRPRRVWVFVDLPGRKICVVGDIRTQKWQKNWLEEIASALDQEIKGG